MFILAKELEMPELMSTTTKKELVDRIAQSIQANQLSVKPEKTEEWRAKLLQTESLRK